MNLIQTIRVALQGKKTYIVASVTVLLGLLQLFGVHVDGCTVQDPVTLLLGGSGLASIRAALHTK